MTEAGYKRMLLWATIWNLAGGGMVPVATGWIFRTAGLPVPFPPAYYYSWIALFLTFGLGYYFAYRDMYRNQDIILLGAIGKSGFAAVFIYNFIAYPRQVPSFFWIPVIGDLVFVVLFVMFLRFVNRSKTK